MIVDKVDDKDSLDISILARILATGYAEIALVIANFGMPAMRMLQKQE